MGNYSTWDKERLEVMWRERGASEEASSVATTTEEVTEVVEGETTEKITVTSTEYEETITVVDGDSATIAEDTDIAHVVYNGRRKTECFIKLASSNLANRKQPLTIKDAGGKAGTYPIVVFTEGDATIDDEEYLVLWINYSSAELYTDGQNWYVK